MRYDILLLLASVIATPALARPVSYLGGTTVIVEHDAHETSILVHHTISTDTSIGLRTTFRDELRTTINTLEVNHLLHRDNGEDHQANMYLRGGFGVASLKSGDKPRTTVPTSYAGFSTDWEDRKYYVSYSNKLEHNIEEDFDFKQSARVGFAPYVAEFGELHTWLMLEVNHHPNDPEGELSLRPLVRFFKGKHLLELGINDRKEAMVNWIGRY